MMNWRFSCLLLFTTTYNMNTRPWKWQIYLLMNTFCVLFGVILQVLKSNCRKICNGADFSRYSQVQSFANECLSNDQLALWLSNRSEFPWIGPQNSNLHVLNCYQLTNTFWMFLSVGVKYTYFGSRVFC